MESKLNKQAIIDGYEDYLKEVNDEPCEISLAEYMTGIFYAIEDTYDLDLVNEAEEELRQKYNLRGDITDEIDEQEFYLEESKEQEPFSGIDFEKQIPHRMRFKEYDIIINEIEDDHDLYWVTQQFFGKEEVEQFAKAFSKLPFGKAYITVRDLSTFEYTKDKKNEVFVTISNYGYDSERIDSTDYENKIKEIGYDFDYETGKWEDNTLEESKTLLQEKEAKIQENINTMKINGVEHDIYDVKLKDERGNTFVTSYPILPEERETAEQVIQSAYEPYKVVSFKPQDTAQFGLKTPRLDVSEM